MLKYSWTFTFKKILTNTYISQKPRQGNCAKKLNAMHFFKMLFLSTVFSLKILYLKVLRSNSKLIILWKVKLCFYLAVAGTFSEFQSIIYGPVTSLFKGSEIIAYYKFTEWTLDVAADDASCHIITIKNEHFTNNL